MSDHIPIKFLNNAQEVAHRSVSSISLEVVTYMSFTPSKTICLHVQIHIKMRSYAKDFFIPCFPYVIV